MRVVRGVDDARGGRAVLVRGHARVHLARLRVGGRVGHQLLLEGQGLARGRTAMSLVDRLRWLVLTSGGLGMAPVAPGTFGTLGGVLLAVLLQTFVAPNALGLCWLGVAAVLLAFGCTQGAFSKRVFKS